MVKKVLVGIFLLGVVGAIVAGIVELVNPSEHAFAQQERGTGQGVAQQGNGGEGRKGQGNALNTPSDESDTTGSSRGWQNLENNDELDTSDNGRGQQGGGSDEATAPGYGRGQGQNSEKPTYAEPQIEQGSWQIIEGTVIDTTELIIETADGEVVQVGLGPSNYRESQGFLLNVGDTVRVSGYWESEQEDEFKATQVENLSMGTQITLRDVSGRPMWSGQGRRGGQSQNSL